MSLTFRWQYWKASAKLICDYFLTGVGRENFGRHYLQYKSIQSPEEISNPHNLFVQATSEWGILGLAGILAMLLGVTYLIAGRPNPHAIKTPPTQHEPSPRWWLWGLSLALVVALLRIPLLGTADPNFIYYATVMTTSSWLLGFICLAHIPKPANANLQAPNHYTTAAILAGLFAFLLHDMINFAMFVPASATTFFAALALVIPASQDRKNITHKANQSPWFWPLVNIAAIGAVCSLALVPTYKTSRCVAYLTFMLQQSTPVTDRKKPPYSDIPITCYADTLDPTPFIQIAKLWILASVDSDGPNHYSSKANDALREAKARDPYDVRLQRLLASVSMEEARVTRSMLAYLAAERAAQATIELYPNDPQGIIDAATIEAEVATALHDASIMKNAIAHFSQALALDDARPWWERIRKLSKQQRTELTAEIQRLTKRAAGEME